MNPLIQYRLALLAESMQISGQMLMIRLHLKQITLEERYALKQRAEKIRALIKATEATP